MDAATLIYILLAITGAAWAVNGYFYLYATAPLLDALRQARFHRHLSPYEVPDLPPLSVVIAARNEARNLERHLPAVLAQAYPTFEVVVADDASTDDTQSVLERMRLRHRHLRIIALTEKTAPGKKRVLAKALEAATYDTFVVTDADCEPVSERWLEHLAKSRNVRTQLVLGYGPYREHPGWLNRWIRYEAVYTAAQYFTAALRGHPYMGVGRNMSYTRRLYDGVGGFAAHEHLAGGDDDLLVSAGATGANTEVCLHPDSYVYSEPKRTWRDYRRQKRRHLSVSPSYKLRDKLWLGLLAASHLIYYAGLVALLCVGFLPLAILLHGIRLLLLWPVARRVMRGLGEERLWAWWPLLDVGVTLYYLFGAFALGGRRREGQRW